MSCWNLLWFFLNVEVLELTFCAWLQNVFPIGLFPHLVSLKPLRPDLKSREIMGVMANETMSRVYRNIMCHVSSFHSRIKHWSKTQKNTNEPIHKYLIKRKCVDLETEQNTKLLNFFSNGACQYSIFLLGRIDSHLRWKIVTNWPLVSLCFTCAFITCLN